MSGLRILHLGHAPLTPGTNKSPNARLDSNHVLLNEVADHPSNGVPTDAELLLKLHNAGNGISWTVLTVFDASAQFFRHLLPSRAVFFPYRPTLPPCDHFADGRGRHKWSPSRLRALQGSAGYPRVHNTSDLQQDGRGNLSRPGQGCVGIAAPWPSRLRPAVVREGPGPRAADLLPQSPGGTGGTA